MRKREWITAVSGLVAVAVLPIVGILVRGNRRDRCSLDGVRIDPILRVRVVDDHLQMHDFCCIRCAELWLDCCQNTPRAVYVTDEASGQEVDSALAYFVRSSVVTMATTGNRIHVFQNRSEAAKHAERFQGTILGESDRPFQPRK